MKQPRRPKKDFDLIAFANRFWEKVDKSEMCWEWTAASNTWGYGHIWRNEKTVKAHRTSWEFAFGPIPDGLFVCHHCDNAKCVNPDHLFLGTQSDNMRDCSRKGRLNRTIKAIGEAHGAAVLTEDQIINIREIYRKGDRSQADIVCEFGVHRTTIGYIVRGHTWAHLEI